MFAVLLALSVVAQGQTSARAAHKEVLAVANGLDQRAWLQPPSRAVRLHLLRAVDQEQRRYRLVPAHWDRAKLALKMGVRGHGCTIRLIPDEQDQLEVETFGDCTPGAAQPAAIPRAELLPDPPAPAWRPSPRSPAIRDAEWAVHWEGNEPHLLTANTPAAVVPWAAAAKALDRPPRSYARKAPSHVLATGGWITAAGVLVVGAGIPIACADDGILCGVEPLVIGTTIGGTGVLTSLVGGTWLGIQRVRRNRRADQTLELGALEQAAAKHNASRPQNELPPAE